MLLLIAGIILLIWWIVSRSGAQAPPSRDLQPQRGKALDILDERYARGEIGKEEYEERKQALLRS